MNGEVEISGEAIVTIESLEPDRIAKLERAAGAHKTRRILVLAARLAISVALLIVVFVRVSADDFEDVWPESIGAAAGWLVAAVLVTALAFVAAAVRWWEVAHTLGLVCSFRTMLGDHLAGQFVSNFLPTTIGGDVLRTNRLGRATGDHYRSFASVVIERLTGWLVLPGMTLIALALDPTLFDDSAGWVLLFVSLGILVLLAGLLWAAEHPRGLGRVAGGTVIRDALGAIHVGLSLYRRRPRAMLRLLVVGAAYQVALVVAAILAAASIGVRPGVVALFAFIPIVLTVQVLPISISGLGVREAALVFLLSSQGVLDAEAILFGLLLYALTLLVSLIGAVPLALGGHGRHRLADTGATDGDGATAADGATDADGAEAASAMPGAMPGATATGGAAEGYSS